MFKISALKAAIATEVEKLGGVALVVIDTTAAYFEGDEENDNVQAGNYARMQRSCEIKRQQRHRCYAHQCAECE